MSPGAYWERRSIQLRCGYLASKWDDFFSAQLRQGKPPAEVAWEYGLELQTVQALQPKPRKRKPK